MIMFNVYVASSSVFIVETVVSFSSNDVLLFFSIRKKETKKQTIHACVQFVRMAHIIIRPIIAVNSNRPSCPKHRGKRIHSHASKGPYDDTARNNFKPELFKPEYTRPVQGASRERESTQCLTCLPSRRKLNRECQET